MARLSMTSGEVSNHLEKYCNCDKSMACAILDMLEREFVRRKWKDTVVCGVKITTLPDGNKAYFKTEE